MGAIAFLLVAVVLSAVGSVVVLVRQRQPGGTNNSIDSFRREMDALAPPDQRHRR
jgi:hypothetical protein